ncbi:MAG: DUF3108 domain-containing protein [Nitrospirae bacterium]|nr:DUF3108 domain-containing protein [Nitrospirota bacterium]
MKIKNIMCKKIHNLFKKIGCKDIYLVYFIPFFIIMIVINSFEYYAFPEPTKDSYKEESLQKGRFHNEKFFYEIYWLGIYAGKAVLETSFDKDVLRISSRANSAPFISTFYTVEDYAESLVKDGKAVHFRIKQREGRYRSNKETIFDINNRKIIYFDYLKSKKKEHSLNSTMWDVISGFFYLRTQPLTIGKAIYINVFDSNKFLKAEVSVLRKEKIKVKSLGEVATIVIKPDLKSEGLFHRKGDIFIWLTDDEKRIPVKIETKVPIGKIVAELKSF